MSGHDRFVAEIRGDLSFEVVIDEDGTYRVTDGWFDCRSSEDQLSFTVFEMGSDVQIIGSDSDAIQSVVPAKGRLEINPDEVR